MGSSQLTSFGATTPALERNDSSTRMWTASGSGATSSWQNNSSDAPSTIVSTSLAVAPKPRFVGMQANKSPRKHTRHAWRGVDGAGRVEHEHRQFRVVLGGEGPQGLLEPLARDCT